VKKAYRDLLRHFGIYGLGQVLSRLASFVLLPFYTGYLRPAEYGCIAILDLSAAVLGIVIGAGMVSAVSRYHFEARDDAERGRVWWTGLTIVTLMATVVAGLAWLGRDSLARLTLGPTQGRGGYYYELILLTLWFDAGGQVLDAYLRVRKWSGMFVGSSLICLLLNIGLNVYLLAELHQGVAGILLGNLIACAIRRISLLAVFMYDSGCHGFDRLLGSKLLRFGGPLVGTALLAVVMNQADRYLLRVFLGMDRVGIYSLAYSIGQAINALCLLPFASIWWVVIYEIAEQPHAKRIYVQVFQYFVYCQMLVLLGVSFFAGPILRLMTAADYSEAERLVPVVCLAYLLFSLHEHFKVPALLAKQTMSLLPAYVAAAVVSIAANLLLVPIFGLPGSAWASVLTFGVFSFLGLWRYRRIDKYDYPFVRCGVMLIGMVLTCIAVRLLTGVGNSSCWLMAILALIWTGWAALLLGRPGRWLGILRRFGSRPSGGTGTGTPWRQPAPAPR
jgi:O-antigen/teichoic acid export membrane protein